jgi:Ca2+-binding RTX toxin-like protein
MLRLLRTLLTSRTHTHARPNRAPALGLLELECRTVPTAACLEGGVLTVMGTDGNDSIYVNQTSGWISIDEGPMGSQVTAIQTSSGSSWRVAASQVTRIVIDAGGGNDTVSLDTAGLTGNGDTPITIPAVVRGGTGNDSLMGGYGTDILLGGAGSDSLCGNSGRDILVGGNGVDALYDGSGGADEDLYIGCILNATDADLQSLLAEWTGPGDIYTRFRALYTGDPVGDLTGSPGLLTGKLEGDADADKFYGQGDTNAYIYDGGGDTFYQGSELGPRARMGLFNGPAV